MGERQVRVAEIAIASLLAPAGAGAVEIVGNPFHGFLSGKMPLVNPSRDSQSVSTHIGCGQCGAAAPIPLPVPAKPPQAMMIHVTMCTITMKEQRLAEPQQILVPMKTRRILRQATQFLEKRSRAIMIADDEMNLALRKTVRQITKPFHSGGHGLVVLPQRAPPEIEDVTVQHQHFCGTQLATQGIKTG